MFFFNLADSGGYPPQQQGYPPPQPGYPQAQPGYPPPPGYPPQGKYNFCNLLPKEMPLREITFMGPK